MSPEFKDDSHKKVIIGFDSWTKGAHHYARLVKAFDRLGYRLILVHIGSWGHDRQRTPQEMIGDLLVRDVSYYPDPAFDAILKKEAPAAVVFLSTRAFGHQAFNRYAVNLGIPTFHLYHGLVSVQAVNENNHQVPYQINWLAQWSMFKSRILKNLLILWPIYIRSLIKTRASMADWAWFVREIYFKFSKPAAGVAPPDTRTLGGFVYTQADVSNMIETYGVDAQHVFAVGNPDLMHFNLEPDALATTLTRSGVSAREVMYIDTGLVEAGIIFDGESDFIDHIEQTRKDLEQLGFRMTIKLHPSHFRSGVALKLERNGFEIIQNQDFVARLQNSVAAIVEPSSAAMLPALIGMPLLMAQYGKLHLQRYGFVLTSYPRARFLKNPKEIQQILAEEESSLNIQATKLWIDENAGPMPASEMPGRVAKHVHEMISHVHKSSPSRLVTGSIA